MKTGRLLIFVLICAIPAWAFQDGTFTASVDKNKVGVGEQFELTFSLSGTTGGNNFRPPQFTDFQVLSGPNQSTNMQFINGTVSSSVSYGYVLQPRSEGKFTIGSASIQYGGKQLQTQPIDIEVTKGAPQQKSSSRQSADGDVGKQIGDNLFLKVIVDKSRVYQGEQITAIYKLYNRTRLTNLSVTKVPSLSGFWSEDLEEVKQIQFANEIVNGKQYNVAVLKKVALFPQRSGTLEIDPMEVRCVVQLQNQRRSNDIFDQFFNDPFFGNFTNYEYKMQNEPLKIAVNPLPASSNVKGFGGAVGKFSMEVWLDKRETKTNDPVTLKVKISGRGNLKLLETPSIVIPPDLERYDPKISDNITHEGNQISGSRTFEYLLIPRHAGNLKINSFPFSYFDIEKKNYLTLNSPEFDLSVAKGSDVASAPVAGISKEDVKLLGEDIRFIKSGAMPLRRKGESFVGSPVFFVVSFTPVCSFIGFMFFVRRRQKVSGDVAGLRNRKARKIAQRRLGEAKKYLNGKKKEEFYTEISRALWGYVADKLGIPPSDLSVEAARSSLESRGIPVETINQITSTIEQCDFARFAQAGDSLQMSDVYTQAMKLISNVEDHI